MVSFPIRVSACGKLETRPLVPRNAEFASCRILAAMGEEGEKPSSGPYDPMQRYGSSWERKATGTIPCSINAFSCRTVLHAILAAGLRSLSRSTVKDLRKSPWKSGALSAASAGQLIGASAPVVHQQKSRPSTGGSCHYKRNYAAAVSSATGGTNGSS